jgi:hypothetical protein
MALTREFKEKVQAHYEGKPEVRKVLLAGAVECLLLGWGIAERDRKSARAGKDDGAPVEPAPSGGDAGARYWSDAVGREMLRDLINATLGFPALAEKTGIHVKTLHQMFGPKGNPTAEKLFRILGCLQEHEGVRLRVVG